MPVRRLVFSLLIAVTTGGGLAACASSPDADDTDNAVEQLDEADEPKFDARDAFEDAAGWIPRETTAVVTVTEPVDQLLGPEVLPSSGDSDDPDDPGTYRALQSDLEELFTDHLGFALNRADAAAVGLQIGEPTVVLFGDFDTLGDPENLDRFEIGDRTAYSFTPYYEPGDGIVGDKYFLLPVDAPRRGMVVTESRDRLERIVGARDDNDTTLATGARGQLFDKLFEEADGSRLATASSPGDLDPFVDQGEMPMPRGAILFFGDRTGITMTGDEADLSKIRRRVDEEITELRATFKKHYDERDGRMTDEFGAIFGYHGFEALADQLQPEKTDDRLRYTVETEQTSWSRFWMLTLMSMLLTWDVDESIEDLSPPDLEDDWSPPEVHVPGPKPSLAAPVCLVPQGKMTEKLV